MSDLFSYAPEPAAASEAPVLSVAQISALVREVVEDNFSKVSVEGEVGKAQLHTNGHVYFDLKDAQNTLTCVAWRTSVNRMGTMPQTGMQVIATGKLTTYAGRSNYQLIVEKVRPAGIGALMQKLEQLKQKLSAEGLFDEARKKPIPFLPANIGIITSPTGAVIRDMLQQLTRRCPRHVLVWPVAVQGATAAEQIAAAIKGFNALPANGKIARPDVLIIARGGGSLEDLWPFNEEVLVRAVAESKIPTISGVGHEPDFTLCDFAADLRAPTPSIAAERAVPLRADILNALSHMQTRLASTLRERVKNAQREVQLLARNIPHPRAQITQARLRLEDKAEQLLTTTRARLTTHKTAVNNIEKLLAATSPTGTLKRGYVYLTSASGKVITSAKTKENQASLHFADGTRTAHLQDI